jgi:SNF2 family DNA or RNA helicase
MDTKPLALEPNGWLMLKLVEVSGQQLFQLTPRSLSTEQTLRSRERYPYRGVIYYDALEGDNALSRARDFLKNDLSECRWNKRLDAYVAPLTDTVAVTLSRAFGERIMFISEETEAEFNRLCTFFADGAHTAAEIAHFKASGLLPKLPECWRELKDTPLSPYQRCAVAVSLKKEAFALFMDKGTGKTATAIQRVNVECQMLESIGGGVARPDGGRMMRVLVICPNQVRINWQREFAKFSWTKGKVSTIRGSLPDRVKQLAASIAPSDNCNFSATIIGYDSLARTIDYFSLLEWDLIICDESHYFKDPRTERYNSLAKMRLASRRRMVLTGTPIGNSPMDLWSQLEFMNNGLSGFHSFKSFRSFHGVFEGTNIAESGVQKLVGLQNIPLLQERLSRVSFSVSKDEAGLCLPDKVRSIHEIEMTTYQADVYKRMQEQLALEIEDKLAGDVDEVTAKNILVQLLRLAQITSGFITFDAVYDEDGREIRARKTQELSPENPKVEATLEILREQDPNAKAIIWCNFIHNIEVLSKALTAAGIVHGCYFGGTSHADRDALVDRFNNDPTFKVLIANPATAGEGLNLLGYNLSDPDNSITYCDLEIFFSSNWSAIQRSQAEDRAHRRGTRMPVTIVDLVVPGTIDQEILDRVTKKRDMADTVSDLRETLNRILQ